MSDDCLHFTVCLSLLRTFTRSLHLHLSLGCQHSLFARWPRISQHSQSLSSLYAVKKDHKENKRKHFCYSFYHHQHDFVVGVCWFSFSRCWLFTLVLTIIFYYKLFLFYYLLFSVSPGAREITIRQLL